MRDEQIRAAVLQTLAEAAPGSEVVTLDPALPFRDQFDFDSVDFVAFVIALERRFAVEVGELDCPRLSTLEGATGFVAETLSSLDPARTRRV